MDEVDAENRTGMTGTGGTMGGRNPIITSGAFSIAAKTEETYPETQTLMEELLEYGNIQNAIRKVKGNKGASGVDGKTTDELESYMAAHWARIERELKTGVYQPKPVREVEIPKSSGKGMRKLGIPTVIDRVIQQALHQVLNPIFDPSFSEKSYGFRPGRSAHQAILKAKEYVAEGKSWVVDIDLEKFFDRVNHDILMSRIARKVKDKRVLLLIRRYLQAGAMIGGLEEMRMEGTPQGGPLSPLLSNILLDDLDRELEKRGHAFCRYADDCNVYVRSKKAGERAMLSVREFLSKKLKLKVNEEKSAVAPVEERKFLGYRIANEGSPKLEIAKESLKRFKERLKKKFRESKGQNLQRVILDLKPKLIGWANYFLHTEVPGQLKGLDGWIRHKLRDMIWRQLKRPIGRIRAMTQRGVDKRKASLLAWSGKGPWRCSKCHAMQAAFTNKYFEQMGLVSLLPRRKRLKAI